MRGIRGALAIGDGTLSAAEFTMDRSVACGGPVHESRSLLSAPSTLRLTRGNRSLSHRQRGRCHFIRREGLPSDTAARPARVLQSRALASALGAARGSAQQITRCVRSQPDDKWDECHGLAVHAVLAHHPTPRRAAAELLESRSWGCAPHACSLARFGMRGKPRELVGDWERRPYLSSCRDPQW